MGAIYFGCTVMTGRVLIALSNCDSAFRSTLRCCKVFCFNQGAYLIDLGCLQLLLLLPS